MPRAIRLGAAARRAVCGFALAAAAAAPAAPEPPYCGAESVWVQILGSGGAELRDGRSAASYLLWIDNRARVLVDAGAGVALRFDEAGAAIGDLDAIVLSRLDASATAGLPALLAGSIGADRARMLPIYGPAAPDGDSATAFIGRMIGADGLYRDLADFLTFRSRGGYRISPRDVPARGARRWAGYGTENLSLSAIPVHHGGAPALAWRIEAGGFSVVFAGSFSNRKNLVADFARGADALIVHHAVPEDARGEVRARYAIPSQIGRIAAAADARMVILGHRTTRTAGLESASRAAIEAHYEGPILFASELECWGL